MSFDDVNDAADQIAGQWFKFEQIGDEIDWRLVSMKVRDQRDFVTGETRVSRAGNIRTEWIMTGVADDGHTYKVSCREGAQAALVRARQKAGGAKFQGNGRIRMRYTADIKPDGALYAFKEFEATYTPPAADVSGPWNDDAPTGVGSVL